MSLDVSCRRGKIYDRWKMYHTGCRPALTIKDHILFGPATFILTLVQKMWMKSFNSKFETNSKLATSLCLQTTHWVCLEKKGSWRWQISGHDYTGSIQDYELNSVLDIVISYFMSLGIDFFKSIMNIEYRYISVICVDGFNSIVWIVKWDNRSMYFHHEGVLNGIGYFGKKTAPRPSGFAYLWH